MERNMIKVLWNNFLKSFKVKPQRMLGELKGEDYLGNKYYELKADPRGGRSRASRWFESSKQDLMQEVPPEWIAWLRRRRDLPPTKEEIIRNLAGSKMKKNNATKHFTDEQKQSFSKSRTKSSTSYPDYGQEYEQTPGQTHYNDDKRT